MGKILCKAWDSFVYLHLLEAFWSGRYSVLQCNKRQSLAALCGFLLSAAAELSQLTGFG